MRGPDQLGQLPQIGVHPVEELGQFGAPPLLGDVLQIGRILTAQAGGESVHHSFPARGPRRGQRGGRRGVGWLASAPRLSNAQALIETYDWYLANRERVGAAGVTHRVPWNQQALGLLRRFS